MRSSGLQRRFAALVVAAFGAVSVLAFVVWNHFALQIAHNLGAAYAVRTVVWQTEKVESFIGRESMLSRKLTQSPLIRHWLMDEGDASLTRQAIAEMEGYRPFFRAGTYFLVVDASRHYYYNDAKNRYKGRQLRYTLSPSHPTDQWYFKAMNGGPGETLNLERSAQLNTERMWVNVVIRDGNRKLGMVGTGLDLGDCLRELVNTRDHSSSTILFDRSGAVTAHRNPRYVEQNARRHGRRATTVYDLVNPGDRKALRAMAAQVEAKPGEYRSFPISIGSHRYTAALAYMPTVRWFDLVLVDTRSLIDPRQSLPILAVMFCAMLLLLVSLASLVQRLVLVPLSRLTTSTLRIADGQYGERMPETRTDEIGQLTRAFNHMSETVQTYTGNLERLVDERTSDLQTANALLSESNKQVMDSIAYATIIQRGVLPPANLLSDELADHFAIWLPRDTVGGDAYFAHRLGDNLVIAIVDCAGHGVPGALMTMSASAILSHHLPELAASADPAALLYGIDESVRSMLEQGSRSEAVPTGMELGLCYWIPAEHRVVFAGARISLWRRDGEGMTEIRGGKYALGYGDGIPDDAYLNHVFETSETDQFYMVTDGWLDQSGETSGGRGFGRRTFHRMLESGAGLGMTEQSDLYLRTLRAFQGNAPQRDDITLLGFRPNKRRAQESR